VFNQLLPNQPLLNQLLSDQSWLLLMPQGESLGRLKLPELLLATAVIDRYRNRFPLWLSLGA
jgi:hypothetical protein